MLQLAPASLQASPTAQISKQTHAFNAERHTSSTFPAHCVYSALTTIHSSMRAAFRSREDALVWARMIPQSASRANKHSLEVTALIAHPERWVTGTCVLPAIFRTVRSALTLRVRNAQKEASWTWASASLASSTAIASSSFASERSEALFSSFLSFAVFSGRPRSVRSTLGAAALKENYLRNPAQRRRRSSRSRSTIFRAWARAEYAACVSLGKWMRWLSAGTTSIEDAWKRH